jgi:hypothetical protein
MGDSDGSSRDAQIRDRLQAIQDKLVDAGFDEFIEACNAGSFTWRTIARARAEHGEEPGRLCLLAHLAIAVLPEAMSAMPVSADKSEYERERRVRAISGPHGARDEFITTTVRPCGGALREDACAASASCPSQSGQPKKPPRA